MAQICNVGDVTWSRYVLFAVSSSDSMAFISTLRWRGGVCTFMPQGLQRLLLPAAEKPSKEGLLQCGFNKMINYQRA